MPKTPRGTRGFREYLVSVVIILLVLAVGAFSLARSITERRREEATRVLKKPEAIKRYEQLSTRTQTKPVEKMQPESVEGKAIETQPADVEEWGSKDKLARWEHLLTRWERFTADKSDDGWIAVASALEIVDKQENAPRHRKTPREVPPEEWARVEACLAREQDLVREILEVAALGGPVKALDFDQWLGPSVPHYRPMREMSGLLMWNAIVKARAGAMPAAAESLVGGMKLGDALMGEPVIVSQGIRKTICEHVGWTLREGFEGGQLAHEDLRRILDELGRADGRKAFADAIRGEGFTMLRGFAALRNGKKEAYGFVSLSNNSHSFDTLPSSLLLRVYTGPLGTPWFNADEAALATTLERIATAAERPYYRAQPELASIDRELESTSYTAMFSRGMFEDYREPLERQAAFETKLDLMRIGLLVEEYGALHGAYPQSLDEIAVDLGGTVPVDPFSGEPYHYSAVGEGFFLYGVGMNGRDDGGIPDWREGDMVWRGAQ